MNLKQSRTTSAIESALNTGSGFALSLGCQFFFLVVVEGLPMTWYQNLRFAVIMTVVSLARSFLWRRFFESRRMSFALSPFLLAVIAERQHQVERRGYTATHDDDQAPGDLAAAGACYLQASAAVLRGYRGLEAAAAPAGWPWPAHDWRSRGLRGDLAAGVALGLAEGERLDRARRQRGPNDRHVGAPPARPVPVGVVCVKTRREQGGAP